MRRIRIHKDITIRWDVTTSGEVQSLEGRDLTLLLTDPSGRMFVLPFSVTNTNRITATYCGKDQSKLGPYVISLAENLGRERETVVDSKDAFILVARSWQEGIFGRDNITTETVELSGDITVGGKGMSAYEVWLSLGHAGTEAEFIASLKGETGEQGEEGVGIQDVRQIQSSVVSLGENIIRVTLTNGRAYAITIRNGAQGETGEKGETGPVGPVGPAGNSIIVEDSLESGSTSNALSASMGRELNYMKIGFRNPQGETAPAGSFPFVSWLEQNLTDEEKAQARANIGVASGMDVVDNLDSTSAQKALSANQGRILNGKIVEGETITAWIDDETQRAQNIEAALAAMINGKQDTISDIDSIRENAKLVPTLREKTIKAYAIPSDGMRPGYYYDIGVITEDTEFTTVGLDSNELEEYAVQFRIGSTVPSLSWPCVDAWEGGSAPVFEADTIYVVAITNGLAVLGKF